MVCLIRWPLSMRIRSHSRLSGNRSRLRRAPSPRVSTARDIELYIGVKLIYSISVGTKHFILARVQTWDHKQPDRAFYSYYNAHHLNKLLFQTQIYLDKKLIHRLHVLNPLTNTDIIGNVVYFMVVGKSKKMKDGSIVRIANDESLHLPPPQQISRTVDITVDILPSNNNAINIVPPSPMVSNLPHLVDPMILNRYLHNQNPSSDENDHSTANDVSNAGWTLASPVTGNHPDSVGAETSKFSKRRSALQTITAAIGNRLSPHGSPNQTNFVPITDHQLEQPQLSDVKKFETETNPRSQLRVQTNFQSAAVNDSKMVPQSASIVETGSRKYAMDQNPAMQIFSTQTTAQTPRDTDSLIKPRISTRVPAGQITLHGEPITPIQALSIVPPSAKSRRRSLSYMNALATSGSNGATLDDWQKMYQRDKRATSAERRYDEDHNNNYDDVKPFGNGGAHDLDTVAENDMLELRKEPPVAVTFAAHIPTPDNVNAVKEEYFYDAILLATDNDFLETSRIRAIFKENAVQPSDYQLFEMPPYTGENTYNRGPYDGPNIPVTCKFCFPSEQQLRNSPTWVRLLHECKCYVLLIVLTLALVILISMAIVANHPAKS